jgi:hypothetical protein
MRGLEGNMQAEPRVFAHDAVVIAAASATQIANTTERGCCLYVGVAMTSVTVTMESGSSILLKGVPAGSFLPILVTHVTAVVPAAGAYASGDIVALF